MSGDPQRGSVDMSGIFEIRDKHGPLLYRLFCVLDSGAPGHGVDDAQVLAILARDQARPDGDAGTGLSAGAPPGRPLLRQQPAADPLAAARGRVSSEHSTTSDSVLFMLR